ncbi:hypothetical protein AB0I10_12605 [Streptomyces sp. NPDC050636]|uniref:hypothetical protein n=1 Tax=Streptomyces sp. NPDC050636 TaxID=3154510 RepID=UPI00343E4C4B
MSVSYGGDLQSTCLLALAAQEAIPYRTFLFANVGDASEDPRTLEYVHNVAAPSAKAHGINLHILERTTRSEATEMLWGG